MAKRVKWRKLGLTVLLRCSQRGSGLYLYLPQNYVQVYEILAGDLVKVQLKELGRRESEEEVK